MNTSDLFLTEVDIHHPRPLSGDELRAYIIQHSLFFDRLITGDSQFNNNPFLRSLIWAGENNDAVTRSEHHDLNIMLQEGYLIPAIRKEYHSLVELRGEHKKRKVDNVPSLSFVKFAEEQLGGHMESYDGDRVSDIFKNRVRESFLSLEHTGKGKLSRGTALKVAKYVNDQSQFLYKSLRDWALEEMNRGEITSREYQRIDKIVAGCYRHNIALSMEINIDVPISPNRILYPFSLYLGTESTQSFELRRKVWDLSPKVFLSREILTSIPAEALLYIKGSKRTTASPRYKSLVHNLENFRRGHSTDPDALVNLLEEYLTEVELVFTEFLPNKQKINYLARKQKTKSRAIVKVIIDGVIAFVGFIPFVGNVLGLIHTGYGAYRDLRDASRQDDYIQGIKDSYILGRASSERFFRIDKGG